MPPGFTWKAYAEGIPTACSAVTSYNDPVTDGRYGLGHTPAILMSRHLGNQANCKANVTGLPSLAGAVLPQFTFLTPNYCDDMHGLPSGNGFINCITGSSALEQRSDKWLATVVPNLVADRATVVVTYDEGGGSALFTVVASWAGVTNGTSFSAATNHYGLLAGTEKALGLSLLGNAAHNIRRSPCRKDSRWGRVSMSKNPRYPPGGQTPTTEYSARATRNIRRNCLVPESAGRMWIVLLALLLRFRPCFRGFGLVRA